MSYIIAKNIKPEAALTSICKVTLSIKGMADKCHHIAASQTAFLFLLLFISAVVIAAASLGPVSGSQISALAGTLRVQPGPLSLPKVAYFDQGVTYAAQLIWEQQSRLKPCSSYVNKSGHNCMFAHQYELKGNNPNIFKYTSHSEERNMPTANKTKCIFFQTVTWIEVHQRSFRSSLGI